MKNLSRDGIDVSNYELDHICYRVETIDRYNQFKKEIDFIGELLSEVPIGGRMIATYKLKNPIKYKGINIWSVELPAPKEGGKHVEGWEHVEFALGFNPEKLLSLYPNMNFETKALKKEINPDVSLKYDDFKVKFHEHTLEYVIKNLE